MVSTLGIVLIYGIACAAPAPTPQLQSNASGYMEWLLDISFTAGQRQQYQRILSDTLRSGNQGAMDAVTSMAAAYEKLPGLSDNERQARRQKMQIEFIKLLRGATDNDSRWLLGLYESAHPGNNTASHSPSSSGGNLAGRWTNGRISSIQYQNAYTGVPAPTKGNSFAWEFLPDGTYSFTGLMQSVMYNCTTAMFSNETGVYTVEGNRVSLRPERNPYRMTNNCAPSSNREGPGKLLNRTYRFRILEESGRPQLELTGDNGAVQRFQQAR